MGVLGFARPALVAGYRSLFEDRTSFFITRDEWISRSNDGYDGELVAGFCAARAKFWFDRGQIEPVSQAVLTLAFACSSVGRPASVLDFGGGAGVMGISLHKYFPELVGRYVAVETEPMVTAAKRSALPFVEFQTAIPSDSFDVVLTSGTLQCLNDPEGQLAQLASLKARKLLLLRNLFSDEKGYIRQEAPLFNHGHGPIPDGFENQTITHYMQTISATECMTIIGESYKVDFTTSNTSGLPMRRPSFVGEDWFCSLYN